MARWLHKRLQENGSLTAEKVAGRWIMTAQKVAGRWIMTAQKVAGRWIMTAQKSADQWLTDYTKSCGHIQFRPPAPLQEVLGSYLNREYCTHFRGFTQFLQTMQ